VGSGYATSLAREVVGPKGLVVAVDIDAATLAFARVNLQRGGLHRRGARSGRRGTRVPRARAVRSDLRHGRLPRCPAAADAAARRGGRLIAPVLERRRRQRLTLLEKTVNGIRRRIIADVLCVSLQGQYGVGSDPHD
jgi:protein-L-isoaspartate O-methyltransferase